MVFVAVVRKFILTNRITDENSWNANRITLYIGESKYVRRLIRGFCPTNLEKLFLEENVGGFDLLSRTMYGVLAVLALATGTVKRSPWKWIVALIAFTGLYSSILRHCTPYSILGISTAKKK